MHHRNQCQTDRDETARDKQFKQTNYHFFFYFSFCFAPEHIQIRRCESPLQRVRDEMVKTVESAHV